MMHRARTVTGLATLCAFLLATLHGVAGNHEVEQKEGLQALYQATNGASWNRNTGWGGASSECTWEGVVCDASGSVVQLHLNKNNLYGTLPGKFFHEMPKLRSLFLQTNRIFYTLPPEVGDLSNAAIVWMHENRISGSIPEEFGALGTHLQQLYLSDNLLDSTIPSELGNLQNLRDLQIGDNRLMGTLPEGIFTLPRIQVVQAQENHLSGSIPTALSNATKLKNLRLDANQLQGTVPSLPAGPFDELRLERNRLSISSTEATAMCAAKKAGALSTCVIMPQGDPDPDL